MIPVDTPEIDVGKLAGAVTGGATTVDVRERGCGRHVNRVLTGVPASQRCVCHHDDPAASGGTWLHKLVGRG